MLSAYYITRYFLNNFFFTFDLFTLEMKLIKEYIWWLCYCVFTI